MNPQDLGGGIPSRITGLAVGTLRHILSLGTLAAAEGRILIRQGLVTLFLAIAMTLAGFIAYVALISAAVAMTAVKLSWGWPVSLAAAGMLHLAFLGILFSMLKGRKMSRPFEATSAELKRDIESLDRFAGRNR